jgi:multidrug efflux pump subunit AcrA (membrane-fusion protein)
MKQRLLRVLGDRRWLAAAAAALVVLAVVGARFVGSIKPDGVATFRVGPGRFVREVEARGSLKAVKATPILVPPESGRQQKVAFLTKDGAFVKAGETVVEFDPYDAEREAADGNADLTAAQAKIEKARAEGTKNVAALGLDKDVAKEQLDGAETFRLTDESLYSRHQIIESQLDRDLFRAKADVAERKLAASGRMSSAERALGEIDAGKARLKVQIAEKGLRSLRIQAPHDGLLVLERNWRGEVPSVGDTLWPGQKVAEVPDLTKLEAKVFVLEADGAGLKEGQKARFAIEGRPGEEYEATVSRVEPLAKTRDWQSPVKYFETTLSLTKDTGTLKPGQKVRAVVRLDEADGVLSIPRGALFEKDGKRVVYRRSGSGFEAVEVTTTRQSISYLVVGGLAAGDVIALRDPNAKRSQASTGSGAPAGPGT